jgi:O-succinylbenzoic acid--CoA ligase
MAERFDPSRPWLLERARLSPHDPALRFAELDLDFAALASRALAVASRLAALGVERGDRVALVAGPSPRWVEIAHATQIAGAVFVPLNTRLSAAEIAALLADCRPKLVLADASAQATIGDAAPEFPRIECDRELDGIPPATPENVRPVDLGAIWTILYTSGTTGTAKGAELTYGNHLASALASRTNLGLRTDDRWLAVLPPYHVGGLSILVRSVLDGSAVTLHPAFDAARVDAALREGGVTLVSLVATALARVLDVANGAPYPPTVRAVLLGGGAVPPELVVRARAAELPVLPTYGLTETCSQVTTTALGEAVPVGSAGRALPGTRVCIANAEADGVGEILVSGPTVMAGYLGRPDASSEALCDGWLHTGDVGRLDERGYLYVLDRRSDRIVTGGENVYPAEVEAAILTHPDVLEAGVYPAADREWGQRVAAAVVLRPGAVLDLEALRAWLGGRLARFKQPRELRVVDALPRTASGKVRRRVLREAAGDLRDARPG